jgi:hypothetical protein
METRFSPLAPKFSLYFEPTGRSTRVTFRGSSRPIGPFKLVSPLMDRIGERNWIRRLHLIRPHPRRSRLVTVAAPLGGVAPFLDG